jgi:hypothetical protein
LDLKPEYVEALYNLGVVLQAREDWEEAATSYRRAAVEAFARAVTEAFRAIG